MTSQTLNNGTSKITARYYDETSVRVTIDNGIGTHTLVMSNGEWSEWAEACKKAGAK